MFGYNAFFDRDFTRSHDRGGVGVELQYDWLLWGYGSFGTERVTSEKTGRLLGIRTQQGIERSVLSKNQRRAFGTKMVKNAIFPGGFWADSSGKRAESGHLCQAITRSAMAGRNCATSRL
jgi:hypothetical protein